MKKFNIAFVFVFGFALQGICQTVTAKLSGDKIVLSDGRSFTITKTKLSGQGAEIEMKAPVGALVNITQSDGKDIHSNEVPFVYTVQDFHNFDKYFKLEVTEGEKFWVIKLKNVDGFRMIIEGERKK